MQTVSAIIPAAGSGSRMRAGRNKLLLEIGGEAIITRTLGALARIERITEVILVARPDEGERLLDLARRACRAGQRLAWARGGEQRRDSVLAGLEAADPSNPIVLVHDGARPFASAALFERVIDAAARDGAALCAVAATDTIKHSPGGELVDATLERDEIYLAQTPQAFRRELILPAYRAACSQGVPTPDDASVLERSGIPVRIVPGERSNRKITHPQDLHEPGGDMTSTPRIGIGFDLHRMEPGRACILGGVRIEHPSGPVGHSDGDALLHALIDALLGAAGLEDIGELYSDCDPANEGIDSARMLAETLTRIRAAGYAVLNCDLILVAQEPRLAPHRAAIRARIAELLGIAPEQVGVKGKTAEGLGPLGCGQALSAQAVVLLGRV